MISLKVRSSLTWTAAKSSARDIATCSHIAVDRVSPDLAISAPISFLTSGMHEPHDVPALVHALTDADVVAALLGDRARGRRPR